jgi:hypothetical protein
MKICDVEIHSMTNEAPPQALMTRWWVNDGLYHMQAQARV